MESRKITNAAVQDLINRQIITDQRFRIVADANNIVSKVGGGFLKIYIPDKSTIPDNELLLYRATKRPELYKKLLATGVIDYEGRKLKYGLFETINGKTLDEVNYAREDATEISKAIFDHIQDVGQIACRGFGEIDEDFDGAYESFLEYIYDLQHKTSTALFMESSTRRYANLGYNLIEDNADLLDVKKPSIIPVDLNFKNIMVTDDNKTKISDHGALIAGPTDMAYGQVMAHGYGTHIFDEFMKHVKDADERALRLFATLDLTNVLSFIVKNTQLDPKQAKPFGNPRTFFDLIDEHTERLRKSTHNKK